jgi:hypothetical protein
LVAFFWRRVDRNSTAVAHALQTKVYCDSRKADTLHCQDDPDLHALLSNDPHTAGVRVVPLSVIASDKLEFTPNVIREHSRGMLDSGQLVGRT